jgi:hypothetical protein
MLQSPQEFFGFQPGSDKNLIHWNDLIRFYQMLARESDRVRCIDVGPTTLGNPFLEVIITSPGNMARLETYRKLSMLLADPRGVDSETLSRACTDGKAICVQTMSMHATEIGGAQMAPLLAHDLAAGDSAEILEILDQVIFILIPCFNPDGEIMIAEWYARYRNTEHDAVDFPRLWHRYAGYGNNSDVVFEKFRESRYLNRILFREWMPQVYADHHQMPRNWARFFVPPYKNPMRPYCSPILWREIAFYGAAMAYQLEEAGVQGVISNVYFPTRAASGYFTMTDCHNIAGILTESSSARMASPYFVHPENLAVEPEGAFYPNPWPGGEWHLSDIVRQQTIAARALLSTMAQNRARILRNMAHKALRQTEAGARNPIQAFLIPPAQHDIGCAEKMIGLLQKQGIELYAAAEPVETAQGVYPAGTAVVPLAQPKYALVMTLLGPNEYPRNKHTLLPDGAVEVYEIISENIAEYMGVHVVAAGKVLTCALSEFRGFARPQTPANMYPGAENESFRQANVMLAAGQAVYRASNGDFYTSSPPADASRIAFGRVGIYRTTCGVGRLGGGNADEGQTRLLFEQYGFPYQTVGPADVAAGMLDQLDVLIFPDNLKGDLNGENESIKELLPEDCVWLGAAEEERIRAFVHGGGRLLALGRSCDYVIETLGLKIKNRATHLSTAQYNTHGSMLRVKIEASPLTVGMPAAGLVFHANPPVLEITEYFKPWLYHTDMRFVAEHVLESGLCVGEAYLAGQPCLVTASYGAGEAVLYAFAPQFRTQTDGTFKALFNALYRISAPSVTGHSGFGNGRTLP